MRARALSRMLLVSWRACFSSPLTPPDEEVESSLSLLLPPNYRPPWYGMPRRVHAGNASACPWRSRRAHLTRPLLPPSPAHPKPLLAGRQTAAEANPLLFKQKIIIELPLVFVQAKVECRITIGERFTSSLPRPPCYSESASSTLVFSQECGIPPRPPLPSFCKCYTKSSPTPAIYFCCRVVVRAPTAPPRPFFSQQLIIYPASPMTPCSSLGESCRCL